MKVTQITAGSITFEDGTTLYSNHDQDCCEHHWLDFEHIKLEDFDGLEFNLIDDSFFRKIEDYGIELVPSNRVKIPGYGSNNGYYSTDLTLVLDTPTGRREYDITECQVIKD